VFRVLLSAVSFRRFRLGDAGFLPPGPQTGVSCDHAIPGPLGDCAWCVHRHGLLFPLLSELFALLFWERVLRWTMRARVAAV